MKKGIKSVALALMAAMALPMGTIAPLAAEGECYICYNADKGENTTCKDSKIRCGDRCIVCYDTASDTNKKCSESKNFCNQLIGDSDGDGNVTINDALNILMYLANMPAGKDAANESRYFTRISQMSPECRTMQCSSFIGKLCTNEYCDGEDCIDPAHKPCENPHCNGEPLVDGKCGHPGCGETSGEHTECEKTMQEKAEKILELEAEIYRLEALLSGNLDKQIEVLQDQIDGLKQELNKAKLDREHCECCIVSNPILPMPCDGYCIGTAIRTAKDYHLGPKFSVSQSTGGSDRVYTITLGDGRSADSINGLCDNNPDSCSCDKAHSDVVSVSKGNNDPTKAFRKITIRQKGTYIFKSVPGTTYNGQIYVEALNVPKNGRPKSERREPVAIVLDNVSIKNDFGPAIYARHSSNMEIALPDGSVNTLIDQTNYEWVGLEPGDPEYDPNDVDTQPNAVIFSHHNIMFRGQGKLIIEANYKHAIASRDKIDFYGGNYDIDVKSVELVTKKDPSNPDGPRLPVYDPNNPTVQLTTPDGNGILGRDGVSIRNGTFEIDSGNHGIRSNNINSHSCGSKTCPRLEEDANGVSLGKSCTDTCTFNFGTVLKPKYCGEVCGTDARNHSGFIDIQRGYFRINAGGDALLPQSSLILYDKSTSAVSGPIDMIANSNIYESSSICEDCGEDPCICDES